MKVADILERTLIKQSNQLDRDDEKESNGDRARRIATLAKDKAKKANPGDSDTVHGWRSDPHQGSSKSAFLHR